MIAGSLPIVENGIPENKKGGKEVITDTIFHNKDGMSVYDRYLQKLVGNYCINEIEYPFFYQSENRDFLQLHGAASSSPDICPNLMLSTKVLMKYFAPGVRVCDVGCGDGYMSVFAALNGCDVVALDINPNNVDSAKINAWKHNVQGKVDVRKSNLFGSLKQGEAFDIIYFNPPKSNLSDELYQKDIVNCAFVDPGYRVSTKYFQDGVYWLKDSNQSKLLLNVTLSPVDGPLGNTINEVENYESIARKVDRKITFFEDVGEYYNTGFKKLRKVALFQIQKK